MQSMLRAGFLCAIVALAPVFAHGGSQLSVTPTTGKAPLTVSATFSSGLPCADGYYLSWGDGTAPETMAYAPVLGVSGCSSVDQGRRFSHTYASPGSYTVNLKQGINLQNTQLGFVTVSPGAQPPQQVVSSGSSGAGNAQFPALNASSPEAQQVRAQIEALLKEVAALQADIARGTSSGAGGASYLPQTGGRSACPLLSRPLKRGSSGDDVSRLQQFLASEPGIYPEAQVSGYYGALTEAAVRRWQSAHGVVSDGDADTTGYGAVGPRTLSAISIRCSGGPSATQGGEAGGLTTPTVGGFIEVTPVIGNAPLQVTVKATVNTALSCDAATYALSWGDSTPAQAINVPAGHCAQMQATFTHGYFYGGSYIIRLSSGDHGTTATVQVSGSTR